MGEAAANSGRGRVSVPELAAASPTSCVPHPPRTTYSWSNCQSSAAPSAPQWQARWEKAVESLGLPVFRMPSGAGHDAMKLHEVMPQAMLFQRGLNSGISHNPLEAVTSDDNELSVRAFQHLLEQLAEEHAA